MEEFKGIKLKKPTSIAVAELLLDPNNPRFSKHPEDFIPETKYADQEIQTQTYNKMLSKEWNFEIEELANSIKSRGFVEADNIFIRKIKPNRYVVVEGNRRLTAIKLLLAKHKEGKPKDILTEEVYKSIETLNCIDLTDNTPEERDFILGLRHHGSLKSWDFLPSAYNIYRRYSEELKIVEPEDFIYDAKIAKDIASLYSLRPVEIRDKLRTYRAYLQLKDLAPSGTNLEEKFSIINDSIKNTTLRKWLKFDDSTCKFDEEGAEKLLDLMFGSTTKRSVITAAAAGEANLRDLAYVIDEGTGEDLRRIIDERVYPSDVKADVKSKKNQRTLMQSLEYAREELNKIKLGEDFGALGDAENELIEEIEKVIKKIRKLSGKK